MLFTRKKTDKTLALKGKYNLRAVLASGPLKKLTIDEIQDNQLIAAAAIDAYTIVVQNCKSVTLYDCLNDTIKVPEIFIRKCGTVEFPSIVYCTIMNVSDSTIVANHETKKLHIDGDIIAKNVKFEGYETIKVNGSIYADSMTIDALKGLDVSYNELIDLGDVNSEYHAKSNVA